MRSSLLCLALLLAAPAWVSAQPRRAMTEDPSTCRAGSEAITVRGPTCAPCVRPRPGEPPRPCPCAPALYECVSSARVRRLRRSGDLGGGTPRDQTQDQERLCGAVRASITRYDETTTMADALRAGCAARGQRSIIEPMELHARVRSATNAQLGRIVRELPRTNPRVACQLSRTCIGDLRTLAISPDGRWLASGGVGGTALWRLADRRRVRMLATAPTGTMAQPNTVLHVAFSADSALLATSAYHDAVTLWRVATGERVQRLQTGDRNNAVAFVRAGAAGIVLVTGGISGPMRTWRVPGAIAGVRFGERYASQTVAASPVAPIVYASSRLWDPRSGAVLQELDNGRGGYLASAFSSDGSLLATAGGSVIAGQDYGVRLFNPVTGRLLRTLTGHTGPVSAVAFSPNGATLASAGGQGGIRLWRTSDGHLLATIPTLDAPKALVFLPSGHDILTASADGSIRTHRVPNAPPRRR